VSSMPLYAIAAAVVLIVFATVLAIFLATLPNYPLELIPGIACLSKWQPRISAGLTLLVDCCGVGLALFLADISRYDGHLPASRFYQLSIAIPVTVLCYVVVAVTGRKIWRVSWTYFGLADILLLFRPLFVTTALSFFVLTEFLHLTIPRGVVIIFAFLGIVLVAGMRSSLRIFRELLGPNVDNSRRIAIFGTDALAASVLHLLRMTRFTSGVPVMFLSDDEACKDKIIAGVRVYSIRDGIEHLQSQQRFSAILYPEGSGTVQMKDVVRQMCRTAQLEFLSVDLQVRPEEIHDRMQSIV